VSTGDLGPQYDPRAWETYRRDAGCGCTHPAPVNCTIPHGTGAWLCVCHRLSGPPSQDTVPGEPLATSSIREHFQQPNRCASTELLFRCERPRDHPGDHRMGRTYWKPRPAGEAS